MCNYITWSRYNCYDGSHRSFELSGFDSENIVFEYYPALLQKKWSNNFVLLARGHDHDYCGNDLSFFQYNSSGKNISLYRYNNGKDKDLIDRIRTRAIGFNHDSRHRVFATVISGLIHELFEIVANKMDVVAGCIWYKEDILSTFNWHASALLFDGTRYAQNGGNGEWVNGVYVLDFFSARDGEKTLEVLKECKKDECIIPTSEEVKPIFEEDKNGKKRFAVEVSSIEWKIPAKKR
jgi:hypothetical protein